MENKGAGQKKIAIIISAVAVGLLAAALIFVFVILPLLKVNKFEIKTVEIQLDGKAVTNIEKDFGSEDFVLSVVINDGADISKYDAPNISWGFIGENLNCTIDNGKVSLGDMLGEAHLRVTISSKNEVSAEVAIKVNSLAGWTLESINILNPPDILQYIEGQQFDRTGLLVVANFQDNSVKVANYTVNPDVIAITDTQVEIAFTNKNVTKFIYIPVSVIQKTLQYISIAATPTAKSSYVEGQKFNRTGFLVTAHYEYLSEIITDFYFDEDKILSPQDTAITLFYTQIHSTKGSITKTVNQPIKVDNRILQSITVDYSSAKLNYVQGQKFDKTGLVVTANYINSIPRIVTNYSVDTDTKLRYDIKERAISYTEHNTTKTFNLKISVDEPYTNFREIIFTEPNLAALSWVYNYTDNENNDQNEYKVYEEYGLTCYQVPVGALVTLSAIDPAVIDFKLDGVAQGLKHPAITFEFILQSGKEPLEVSFRKITDRVTVNFSSAINSAAFSYAIPWSGRLSERDLEKIAFIFSEDALYYYNIYIINGEEHKFFELIKHEFSGIDDTEVTIESKEKTTLGEEITFVFWPGFEVVITVDKTTGDWLPNIERIGYILKEWIDQDEKKVAVWEPKNNYPGKPFLGIWNSENKTLYSDTSEPIGEVKCQIKFNQDGTYSYISYLNEEENLNLWGIYEYDSLQNEILVLSIETNKGTLLTSYDDFGINLNNSTLTVNILIELDYELYII